MARSEWCSICAPGEHINQEARCVHKHEHQGYPPGVYPCDKPWSALCQTDHGQACFVGDYTSQPEATQALDEHIRAGKHISSDAEDSEPVQECRVLVGKGQGGGSSGE